MPRTRKNYAPSLKAKVAVEAIKGSKTAAQIAQTFSVHPNLVAGWKKQALAQLPEIFSNGHAREQADFEKDELYQQIGRLKVELDFLKKRAGLPD
jgi:transposase-like protein